MREAATYMFTSQPLAVRSPGSESLEKGLWKGFKADEEAERSSGLDAEDEL